MRYQDVKEEEEKRRREGEKERRNPTDVFLSEPRAADGVLYIVHYLPWCVKRERRGEGRGERWERRGKVKRERERRRREREERKDRDGEMSGAHSQYVVSNGERGTEQIEGSRERGEKKRDWRGERKTGN